MDKKLISVGLDVGTTSTQLMVSELQVENRAGMFSVPEMEITHRKIRYTSPVHFTPLVEESKVDGEKIRELVEEEYKKTGISRDDVDTGAVIITGETSRKENAAAVLAALSDYAGEFVVATAGPELESVLAARGAGAVDYSRATGERVLHMDIGGGTANLAWIDNGEIVATDCLNVGGRLIKVRESGEIYYISPVLKNCGLSLGQKITPKELEPVAETLTQALEMSAGLRPTTEALTEFRSQEVASPPNVPRGQATLSFSGGVADCIDGDFDPFAFGDMGPVLGKAIRKSRLCQGKYRLGEQTIRATVIGAGCHSAQLSGSTVYWENVVLPMKNLPVVAARPGENLREKLARQDTKAVIVLPGLTGMSYGQIKALGRQLAEAVPPPVLVAVEEDMAKALGQAIALAQEKPACLCIDRVRLGEGDYLDVGNPIGPALPVVVKTLVFSH